MDINTYITTPQVQSIIKYWQHRYSHNCTTFTKEELLSEAYLGAWETILKYAPTPFKELLTLISLGVKWKLCNYIKNSKSFLKLHSFREDIDINEHSTNLDSSVYVKETLTRLKPRECLILNMIIEGYKKTEIAQTLDITKQRVHQILRKCGK